MNHKYIINFVEASESRINNNDTSAFTALWTKNKNKNIWIENENKYSKENIIYSNKYKGSIFCTTI